MGWVHTWAGVIFGALMFTVFWMGTLTVFDKEIDRWMQPETRLQSLERPVDIDALVERLALNDPAQSDATYVYIGLPNERMRHARTFVSRVNGDADWARLTPATGAHLAEPVSHGASDFFFPMHFRLLIPGNLGWWLVMVAALGMILLIVTGVIIHRKIFAEFFTFRPKKKLRRSSLDLHNLSGVVFLPFHFMIAFSGLMTFSGQYGALFWEALPGTKAAEVAEFVYEADNYGWYERDAVGQSAAMVSIAPLLREAETIWSRRYSQKAVADTLYIINYGDVAAYMMVKRLYPKRRTEMDQDSIAFDLATGEILKDYAPGPVRRAQRWLSGLHFIQFEHWPLRWLYFIGGLAGCVMIATGFLFWMRARIGRDGTEPFKVRMIRGLTAGATTGMIVATGAFLVANRILPREAEWSGIARADLEVWFFFAVWIGTLLHAGLRNKSAWTDHAAAIGALAVSAVILNGVTTGDHLVSTIGNGHWAVAGVDLVLLATALISIVAIARLRKTERLYYNRQGGRPQREAAQLS